MQTEKNALDRNSVGLSAVVFQSIATMGPAVGLAYSIGVGAGFAGGALPASVVLATVACLLVAISIGQLARHLPSAGGPATYAGRGLHPGVGFMVGWGYGFAYMLAVPFLMLLVGYLFAGVMQADLGWPYAVWIPAALAAGALVFIVNYVGVRVSTRVGTILGGLEILVFVALSLTLIAKAGSHNTAAVFGDHFATVAGFQGVPGIIVGSVYGILAFIGFDAAAPLGEEARNPRRTVQFAVIASCLLVGAFYVLGTYAATVFFGPAKFAGFSAANGGNPWTAMAQSAWGVVWVIVFIALLNSAVANINGAANAGTRVLWSLGRARLLPAALERTHSRWSSPHVAVILTFILGAAITLALGIGFGPTTAYAFLGTMIVGLVIPVYAALNLASLVFYLRERRSEFNPLLHVVVPVLGVIVLAVPFMAALGITLLSFISALTYPLNLAGPAVAVWYLIGLGLVLYLSRRHPQRVRQTARVFADETDAG